MSDPLQSRDKSPKFANALLEGGGVRGMFALVGALVAAEQRGYRWLNLLGSSAGAFVAAMMAAGYRANEMYSIMRDEVDFIRFAQDRGFNGFFLGEAINLRRRGGLHSGDYIVGFMKEKLGAKGIATFGDLILQKDEPKESNFRYRLTVIASNIDTGQMLRLPQDMLQYGVDPDQLDIAPAVRMSISMPLFLIPVTLQRDGRSSRIVDGSIFGSVPISFFDVKGGELKHPTFSFCLRDLPYYNAPRTPWPEYQSNFLGDSAAALTGLLISREYDRLYMDDRTYACTITIDTSGIDPTQYNLSREQSKVLYENGIKAAEEFFVTWDLEAYKASYREQIQLPSTSGWPSHRSYLP